MAEERNIPGPEDRDDVWGMLRYLDRLVDQHITRSRELAVEVDSELRELVAMLRPLTGDRRHRIARCPRPASNSPEPTCRCGHASAQHDNDRTAGDRRCNEAYCGCRVFIPLSGGQAAEGEADPDRCGEMLWSPTGLDGTIRCSRCGYAWAMDEWLTLGDDLNPAE